MLRNFFKKQSLVNSESLELSEEASVEDLAFLFGGIENGSGMSDKLLLTVGIMLGRVESILAVGSEYEVVAYEEGGKQMVRWEMVRMSGKEFEGKKMGKSRGKELVTLRGEV